MHPVAAAVATFVAEHGLAGPMVAGVSGGPDSTALLHALREAGLTPHVAHLHHGLRGADADADADFVAALAAELGLPCTVERADLAAAGGSLEDRARRARRAFLARVARATGAGWVALGHTADDQAETVLHHVVRGTGLRGLGGMRPVQGRVVRPLLGVRRAAVLDYLAALGAGYRIDASNADPTQTRNRIRHDLLPKLAADYNPQVVEALNRLGRLAGAADDWIAAEVEELGDRMARREPGAIRVEAAGLAAAPAYLRLALLRQLVAEAAGGAGGVTLEHAEEAAALAFGAGPPVALPGGVVARRAGDEIELRRPPQPAPRWEITAAVPGATVVEPAGIRVEISTVPPPDVPATPPGEAYLDAERLRPPLVVRNRRPGDRFHGLGAPGGQKLKQFLADRKVPAAERDRVPLLADAEGIVCVLGYRIADRVKVTPDTASCLHVVVRRL